MDNELTERTQITRLEEFKQLHAEGHTNYSNYDFMFPFGFSDSESHIRTLGDRAYNFSGAVFYEKVEFNDIAIPTCIEINGPIFKKEVIFDSVSFEKNFVIKNCTFNEIKFSKVICKKLVIFDSIRSISNFTARNCTFQHFEFLSSPITKLILEENSFLGKFKVSHNDLEQRQYRADGIDGAKVKIERLTFKNNTIAPKELVRFGYLSVDCFHFENMNNPIGSEINIGECDFRNFTISHVRNAGRLIFYRMNEKADRYGDGGYGDLVLKDSHLGDSDLQNVNLECYRLASIKNSLLSDMKYTGVQWPDNIETDGMETDEKKRDKYRTLKNVAQKNNDAPRAITFYAKEMEAYSRTLSWKKGERIDVLILWFNQKTNNFGLNWMWPIGWILGLGFLLYILLLSSCSGICNPDVAGKLFVFLNPTHKIEFVCKGSWGFFTYFFDLVFRLIETTLIYQTIVAFRKFTRKL